jgi:hypothetical protein
MITIQASNNEAYSFVTREEAEQVVRELINDLGLSYIEITQDMVAEAFVEDNLNYPDIDYNNDEEEFWC